MVLKKRWLSLPHLSILDVQQQSDLPIRQRSKTVKTMKKKANDSHADAIAAVMLILLCVAFAVTWVATQ